MSTIRQGQLAALGEWIYPSPQDRAYFDLPNIGLFLLPVLLHLVTIHLLLRHPKSALANTIRSGVLLPLCIVFSIRAGMGAIMKPLRFGPNRAPGHKGEGVSWFWYTVGGEQTEGGWQHFHVAIGVYGAYSVMKALEWGLAKEPPRLRKELLDVYRASLCSGREVANGTKANGAIPKLNGVSKEKSIGPDYLPTFLPGTWIPLGMDLLTNLRGIGWEWGIPYEPNYLPSTTIPHLSTNSEQDPKYAQRIRELNVRRAALIRTRFFWAFVLFLLMDGFDSILKQQWLFGSRSNLGGPLRLGGSATESLRYEELSAARAWLLTVMAGVVIPTSMSATYCLLSALALVPAHLFPNSKLIWKTAYADPAHWAPPLFRRPHLPKDLRTLWSTEWHHIFRGAFLAVAYRPMNDFLKSVGLGVDVPARHGTDEPQKHNGNGHSKVSKSSWWQGPPGRLLRRALCVLSVFLASGLMHEAGQLAMARTTAERDYRRFWGRGEPILVYYPPKPTGVLELAYIDRGGRAVVFFLMQGLACILEDVVELLFLKRKSRGKSGAQQTSWILRVLGWLWTACWIIGWGHYVGKTWFRMGIAQGFISIRGTSALVQLLQRARA
ncbi:hypothetical protein OC845_005342 [Tilletia horrida]|nr:hypothetical protein OC845_005342 [Tilletia horrida]